MAVRTPTRLRELIVQLMPDNTRQLVVISRVRGLLLDMVDSLAGAGTGTGTGAAGEAGSYERSIFRASANQPPTPNAPAAVANDGDNPNLPAGWTATPPASPMRIWVSLQRIARGSLVVTYTTPRPFEPTIPQNSVTAAQARADSVEHRHEWRDRILSDGDLDTPKYGDDSVVESKLSAEVRDKLNAHGEGQPSEQRVLVDAPASAATRDKIILEDAEEYLTVDRVVHEATPAEATYRSIRFDLGYFGDESALDPQFYAPGRFYYNFLRHSPRVVAYIAGNSGPKRWVDADAADLVANITADVGYFPSDDEATPHVTAVGNVFYHQRLRTYRRVQTFTPGQGAVTAPQRRRLANEEDLRRIDAELAKNTLLVQVSPQFVDKDDPADRYEITFRALPGAYSQATRALVALLVPTLAEGTFFAYDPNAPVHRFSVPLTDDQKDYARARTPGQLIFARVQLYDADGPLVDARGVELDPVWVSLDVITGPRIGKRQMADAIGDLERRASDLRVVAPPGWETAVGAGIGISLARAVVADPSALAYQSSVDIPADAAPGDDYLIYLAVPTAGLNLSDYRIDLDGFAQYPGFNFGETATAGDRTILTYLFTVGDGSGGFASGTAPGATLTLQHHGTTPHTAFSGDLEGRALQQVRDTAGTGTGTPGSSVGPATESTLGTVRGATAGQAGAASGTVILGWSLNRLRTAIRNAIPAATTSVRGGVLAITQAIVDAGTSTGSFAWSIPNALRLIRSQIASWARQGDVSSVPAAKLGAGTRDGTKFLRDDGTWQEVIQRSSGEAHDLVSLRHTVEDLEAETADLAVSGALRWAIVPQLSDAESPAPRQLEDNLGPAIYFKPDNDDVPGRDSEALVLSEYNAARWRNSIESGISTDPTRQGGSSGTLWIRLPDNANLNHYRLVVEYAGIVGTVALQNIATRWNGLDDNGILGAQHLWQITHAVFGARVPYTREDMEFGGFKLQIPGEGSVALETRDRGAHTRFEGALGAAPLEQVSEVANAAAAPHGQIIDLHAAVGGVNDITWDIDEGPIASILLSGTVNLSISGGKPGQVAFLFLRRHGGVVRPVNLQNSITAGRANTPIVNHGHRTLIGNNDDVHIMKFVKAGVHIRGTANEDTTIWNYLGFQGLAWRDAIPSQVIQAAIDAGDTAGVTSVVLPANYATFRRLHVAVWDVSSDRLTPHEIPTAVLAAQTAARELYEGFAILRWNPATRVIDSRANPADRLVYVELHD